MADTERQPVVYVQRSHGAWLIHFVGTYPHDSPETDNFDAAASLRVAKRLAREGASTYATNLRWREAPGGWVLEGVEDEWEG